MGVNKVVFGSVSVIDISDSTVAADKLLSGYTAYDKAGNKITGTMTLPTRPYIEYMLDEDGYITGAKLYGGFRLIPSNMFLDNTLLESVDFSESQNIESIEESAFAGCYELDISSLPNSLISIGYGAFMDCSQLALTELPNGVESIGSSAFSGCNSLALTSLPNSLIAVGEYAFDSCSYLAITSLPYGLQLIGEGAFHSCIGLTSIEIPSSLDSLANLVFSYCENLEQVVFLGTPTTIGGNVFLGCGALLDIYVPWLQGDVMGAPWGATNATIHYNSMV